MESASTAIGRARVLLDPTGSDRFSDAKLIPYLNIAYSQLRDEGITAREVTFAEAVAELQNVPAGTFDLSAYVKPGAVLASLANPITIWEKPAGSSDDSYQPVQRVNELPARTQTNYLLEYEWLGGDIVFLGATQNLDLKVRYEQIFPPLKAGEDALGAIGVANILGYWTAGIVCRALREETLAQTYIAEARHLLFMWISKQIKDSQGIVRQPRRFRPHEDSSFIRQL